MSKPELRASAAPPSSDPVGIARFASLMVSVLGAVGVGQAVTRTRLSGRQRVVAGAVGAAATAAGITGAYRPRGAAAAFFEHPRAVLAAGVVPIAIAPVTGGRRTPLELLAVAALGVSGATLGERGRSLGRAAAAYWIAQTIVVNGWDEPRSEDRMAFTYVVIPLAIEAAVNLAPKVLEGAREFRDLDQQLDGAEADLGELRAYQDALREALDDLGSALADADEAVGSIEDDDDRRVARDLLLRSRGRLQERLATLEVARDGMRGAVEEMVSARVTGMRLATPAGSGIEIAEPVVETGLRVEGSQALTVLAVAVTTLLSNALRHARGASKVEVALMSSDHGADSVVLTVADDGDSSERTSHHGRGLGELAWRVRGLGGSLEAGPRDGGGWTGRLEMPVTEATGLEHELASERVLELIDDALAYSVRACALMVVALAFRSDQIVGGPRTSVRLANSAVVAAYELAERRGLWSMASRREAGAQDASRRLLTLAAAVAAVSPHRENALLSGWANAAVARHGLLAPRGEIAALTAAHALAILVSYRGGLRQGVAMAIDQVGTCAFGPLGIGAAVSRARRALEARETALTTALSALEQTQDLAESFNRSHPCTDSTQSLTTLLDRDSETRSRLCAALDRIDEAALALPTPPSGHAWAGQFADALRARIWPTPVRLVSDDETLPELDPHALSQAVFRRRSLAVADGIGDVLRDASPPDWLGRRTLDSVTLNVSAEPVSGTVRCEVVPERRGRIARESTDRLALALANLGGALTTGHADGRITFDLYPGRYASPVGQG